MLKLSFANTRQMARIGNALATELRVNILALLEHKNMNVVEIASALDVSISTVAANIRILEESGLIVAAFQPARRGSMKVCSAVFRDIFIDFSFGKDIPEADDLHTYDMPVGMFSYCIPNPSCGMADEKRIIGIEDDPSSFFLPQRSNARILWFRTGVVEYLMPIKTPIERTIHSIQLEYEACSEAPGHNNEWKSDISLWINDVEVGVWHSPGDFGDRAGRFNPQYWVTTGNTQYGMLNRWLITKDGTFFFDNLVSKTTLSDVLVPETPYIKIRIGVKENAQNPGGVNLFGRGFGDHDMGIKMTIRYQKTTRERYAPQG